jgi:valyl-tRNA synthetase
MNDKFLKPYNPQETEPKIYKIWQESGFFNPDNLPERHKVPYTIMMPPPNVTGILHMGHAMMLTIEDIMIRFERMQGRKTLWLPGTDHAAIATQARVEKDIYKKEGKNRYDLGRDELLTRIDKFAKESHDTITSQIKILGASCDWSREAFTLDEKRNLAVRTVFKKMYDDGLIYRGNRIVNWDPKGQTTISDDEIVYEERDAKMYTFKYSKDFPISISTTRPETKVGDTAVAVHPEDERYKKYVGKEYDAVFCGVPIHIKIITDKNVEKDFGTGALGVTPAHSIVDWEMGLKNNLPVIQVIDERAKMMVGEENIKGKKVTEAREVIVEWLRSEGLLEKEENIKQNVSTAERTGGIVEPLPKLQWFVAVNKKFILPHSEINEIKSGKETTLKEIMKNSVENGQIEIIPEYFNKTYFHWIDNLGDWCISRQIWYGHRIPVWYKDEKIFCDIEAPKEAGWKQDEDTLDTWFSSALWTFSTLGWPEKIRDLEMYHPTDMLETGYEIIFFWVARMIMMSGYVLGMIPFKKVYFHGTVRDAKGRKMSKSLNNGIDPIEVAHKFGMDAGRMALIVGVAPGTDSKISEDKIRGYKNFANKVWNIARFVFSNTENVKYDSAFGENTPTDKELTEERKRVLEEITREMKDDKIYLASEKLYHYIWHRFADIILEESKNIFNTGKEEEKKSRKQFLLKTLDETLRALHPFMPFLTEEIWQYMPIENKKLLMVEKWPI